MLKLVKFNVQKFKSYREEIRKKITKSNFKMATIFLEIDKKNPLMAIQYQFAAGVLYCEVAVVILLCLPFISNRFWARIFKWKILKTIGDNFGSHVFLVFASILGLLFFDSVNSMTKYEKQSEEADEMGKVIIGHDPHSSKFRAQRNFYITMFAFVFWIVLRRLVSVIANAAQYR